MDLFCYFCFVFVILSSVHCSPTVTCWERADLLALLYVMFSCVFVTFPCGVLCQVWCLIISIPDLCLTYFTYVNTEAKQCGHRSDCSGSTLFDKEVSRIFQQMTNADDFC